MRYQINGKYEKIHAEGHSQLFVCLYRYFLSSFKDNFLYLKILSKTALRSPKCFSFRQEKNFLFYFWRILLAKNYDKISFWYHKESFLLRKSFFLSRERECECLQTLTSVRHLKLTKADKNSWWNIFLFPFEMYKNWMKISSEESLKLIEVKSRSKVI